MKKISPEEQTDALKLLKNILSIPTVNSSDNESVLADFLQQYFQSFGIESKIQQIDETHANLLVDIPGEDNSEYIVWNGHMDTVPYGSLKEWNTSPQDPIIQGNNLIARGASDMKSGLAAMVATICIMKAHNIKPKVNLRFIATCDEEKDGLGARKVMEKGLLDHPSLILIGEPTDLNLGIAQKGCLWLEFNIKGRVSHSAYPWEGINAIQYGMKICGELQEYVHQFAHPLLSNSTAEITMLNGGIAPNMVPDYCKIIMDIRYTPNLSYELIMQKLNEICQYYKDKTNYNLDVAYKAINHRIGIETEQNNAWLERMCCIIHEYNIAIKYIGINFFTDASIFTESFNIPTILFGPGCPDMAHKPNESVNINKFYDSIDILSNTFYNSLK